MSRNKTQDILDSLSDVRRAPVTEQSIAALRKALVHNNSVVVGKAARIIAELEIQSLHIEMAGAFDRFMVEAAKDKGCTAKAAIAEALYQLGVPADAVFIRGIRHRQMEGSFGPPVDVAVDLRGSCAMGLARMAHPDAMLELVDLLADKEAGARLMAARAIGYSEHPSGIGVLRLKALLGDKDPMVVGECIGSLMKIEPRGSLKFVGRFLDDDEQVADLAALSLGGSRLPEALGMLAKWYGRSVEATTRKTALLAIAMLRLEPAVLFLLERLTDDSTSNAEAAIDALAIYRHDPSIRPRVDRAVANRADRRKLSAEIQRAFAP